MKSQRKKVSTACQACRKRKSRCDGLQPQCRTCQTHGTACLYNFDQDSRKTPSKAYIAALKNRIAALERILDQILDARDPARLAEILRQVREQRGRGYDFDDAEGYGVDEEDGDKEKDGEKDTGEDDCPGSSALKDMTTLIAHLHVDEQGAIYSVGATSNVIDLKTSSSPSPGATPSPRSPQALAARADPTAGFNAGSGVALTPLEHHLIRLYLTWQHPVFYLFSPERFMRDLATGGGSCFSPLLLAAVLATGCHFSDLVSEEQGQCYFAHAKSLLEHEIESPSLTTCQALALMGIREAGRGKERGSGWLYSGMAFRMAVDLGIHEDPQRLYELGYLSSEDVEERALTFWASYVSDKGWTAYLGRPESLPYLHVRKYVRLPAETYSLDATPWAPYDDTNFDPSAPPVIPSSSFFNLSRFKYVCQLVEHLAAIVRTIYHKGAFSNKGDTAKQCVTDLHTKLCAWFNSLPHHMRISPRASPAVLLVYIFYHTALILLFRPFIRSWSSEGSSDGTSSSPSPSPSSLDSSSPLAICTSSALAISRYVEQYRRNYTLRRYCNWMVHAVFTASTIYVINGAAHSHSTPAGSEPQDAARSSEIMNIRKEAIRKLRELMGALQEMGCAWQNAQNCLSQIRQWIQKYQLGVNLQTNQSNSPVPPEGVEVISPVASGASDADPRSRQAQGQGPGAAWQRTAAHPAGPENIYYNHPRPNSETMFASPGAAPPAGNGVLPTAQGPPAPNSQLMSDFSALELDYGIWNDMIQDFMHTDTSG